MTVWNANERINLNKLDSVKNLVESTWKITWSLWVNFQLSFGKIFFQNSWIKKLLFTQNLCVKVHMSPIQLLESYISLNVNCSRLSSKIFVFQFFSKLSYNGNMKKFSLVSSFLFFDSRKFLLDYNEIFLLNLMRKILLLIKKIQVQNLLKVLCRNFLWKNPSESNFFRF